MGVHAGEPTARSSTKGFWRHDDWKRPGSEETRHALRPTSPSRAKGSPAAPGRRTQHKGRFRGQIVWRQQGLRIAESLP